jgi:hypothetical protein
MVCTREPRAGVQHAFTGAGKDAGADTRAPQPGIQDACLLQAPVRQLRCTANRLLPTLTGLETVQQVTMTRYSCTFVCASQQAFQKDYARVQT